MLVAIVFGVKGGICKSTLARCLAVEAAKNRLSVLLADTDLAQGTCLDWSRRRVANGVRPNVLVQPFRHASQAIGGDHDFVVIDTPGRITEGTRSLADIGDILIQPSSPSLDDLTPAIRLFHDMVKLGTPRGKLFMAMTNVLTDAEEAAGRTYIENAGYAVLDGSIPARASLRDIQNGGRALQESRYPALNQRVDVLLQSVIDKMEFA